MNKYSIVFTVFTSIAAYTSNIEYKKRDDKREEIIRLIQGNKCASNSDTLKKKLVKFLNLYPYYNLIEPRVNFNCNYTLYGYLTKYEKQDCWPVSYEINQNQPRPVTTLPHTYDQSTRISPTSSSTYSQNIAAAVINSPVYNPSLSTSPTCSQSSEESLRESSVAPSNNLQEGSSSNSPVNNLSTHLCNKSPLNCAFTCNRN